MAAKYLTMVGQLQWLVTLGRFDIHAQVATMSRFRHNILAFHRVREAIAAKFMAFYWIQSAYNLSDMLSKHWDHPTVHP